MKIAAMGTCLLLLSGCMTPAEIRALQPTVVEVVGQRDAVAQCTLDGVDGAHLYLEKSLRLYTDRPEAEIHARTSGDPDAFIIQFIQAGERVSVRIFKPSYVFRVGVDELRDAVMKCDQRPSLAKASSSIS